MGNFLRMLFFFKRHRCSIAVCTLFLHPKIIKVTFDIIVIDSPGYMCINWSDLVKSMTFGTTMLDYTLRNILRFGAIPNFVQEVNGSDFSTWPPLKHVYDISQSHLFSITCLKWIICFQVDKIFIIKTSYVVTELFLAMCHC